MLWGQPTVWQCGGVSVSVSLCVRVSVCLLERLPVALRIRNLLATHCETILLRYFVAVNNALVYLLSGEAWQREGTQGGSSSRCAQH